MILVRNKMIELNITTVPTHGPRRHQGLIDLSYKNSGHRTTPHLAMKPVSNAIRSVRNFPVFFSRTMLIVQS